MDETGETSQTGAGEERGAVDPSPVVEPASPGAEPAAEQPMATPGPRSRRRFGTLAAAAGLIVVLAGAAYVGASWLSRPKASARGGGGAVMMGRSGDGGKTTTKMNIEPAKELPATKPDVMGLMTERKDNSVFLKTGGIMVSVQKGGANGEDQISTSADGPLLEVVVTHDTQIYRDDTELGKLPQSGSTEATVQQVVKPGSLDEIKENSVVQVWGEKHGDRTVARALSYRLTIDRMSINGPGG